MRYLDTGSRDPDQALGSWLIEQLSPEIAEVRWQSGFFTVEGLALLAPTLQRLALAGGTVKALIGSNGGDTLRNDVIRACSLMGLPRPQARLGVVSYAGGAFFHPKVYHFQRDDGSQCAYVGSANLTGAGVSSLHIEAGVVLDSRDGDTNDVLGDIANAIDQWFANTPDGFYEVTDDASVDALVAQGILALAPPPAPPAPPNAPPALPGGPGLPNRPRLRPLLALPQLPGAMPNPPVVPVPQAAIPQPAPGNPAAPRQGFPQYMLFAPNPAGPTVGANALSGASLPGGVDGLVIRLNRDSARHFRGGGGTANISIPVTVVPTLRFGLNQGGYDRPRVEFPLLMRYVGQATSFRAADTDTNIMAYGFLPGEKGHGDVRMVVRKSVRTLLPSLAGAGLPLPQDGDYAFLEWPTQARPEIRLTFLERGSALHQQADTLFATAVANGQTVGDGACWLPPGISPIW